MNRYRAQVGAALDAVAIRGPTGYAWLGVPSRPVRHALAAALDAPARREYLVRALREELYRSFYCHGTPVPARSAEPDPGFSDSALVAALSAANCGSGTWEAGWTVQRVQGGEAIASRAGVRVRVAADHCLGARVPGAAVRVRMPKALPAQSPGFYTAVGDAADDGGGRGAIRVYWNVGPAGAPLLVGAVTACLNGIGVPFRLKVADHPGRFARCDAAVLYLEGDAFSAARAALGEIAAGLGGHLRPEIPAFTLPLAAGVGLAEDDRSGESFGVRRCALLAEAIVAAHQRGITGMAARLEAVVHRFARVGVAIDAPYLEPSLAGRHVL